MVLPGNRGEGEAASAVRHLREQHCLQQRQEHRLHEYELYQQRQRRMHLGVGPNGNIITAVPDKESYMTASILMWFLGGFLFITGTIIVLNGVVRSPTLMAVGILTLVGAVFFFIMGWKLFKRSKSMRTRNSLETENENESANHISPGGTPGWGPGIQSLLSPHVPLYQLDYQEQPPAYTDISPRSIATSNSESDATSHPAELNPSELNSTDHHELTTALAPSSPMPEEVISNPVRGEATQVLPDLQSESRMSPPTTKRQSTHDIS